MLIIVKISCVLSLQQHTVQRLLAVAITAIRHGHVLWLSLLLFAVVHYLESFIIVRVLVVSLRVAVVCRGAYCLVKFIIIERTVFGVLFIVQERMHGLPVCLMVFI